MLIPTILDNHNNKEVAFDIYSRLLCDRIIFLSGEINDESANLVISELLYLDSLNHDDIYLYINSPGGEVSSGLAIYDTINYIKSDVSTIGLGLCASMGAFILSSGTKKKRCMLKNAEAMIHEVLASSSGQATEILIATQHIKKVREKLNHILAKNTNQTYQKICKDTNRDYYMDAKEALKYGLIDKII